MQKGFIALLLSLGVIAYTTAVLIGCIPKDQRIDASHLTLIVGATLVVLLLVSPEVFERILKIEAGGIKLELDKVKLEQEKQADKLEDISILLPLVLPENERAHLFNLADGNHTPYTGSPEVQREIRHLRSMGLVTLPEGKTVADMRVGGSFQLADHVALTSLGKKWVNLLRNA